jgi:hypothetical protein
MRTIDIEVGIKLRQIRKHLGLGLKDVELLSNGEFSIQAVGTFK